MNETVQIAAGVLSVLVATVLYAQFLQRYVIGYDLTNDCVRILLFRHIPVYWISISNIYDVYYLPRKYLLQQIATFRIGNRLWADAVILHKSRGLCRSIIITPDDPMQFVDEIRRRKTGRIQDAQAHPA